MIAMLGGCALAATRYLPKLRRTHRPCARPLREFLRDSAARSHGRRIASCERGLVVQLEEGHPGELWAGCLRREQGDAEVTGVKAVAAPGPAGRIRRPVDQADAPVQPGCLSSAPV